MSHLLDMQQNNHSYSKAPQLTVASVLHSNTTCNKTICPSSLFFSLLYTLSTSSLSKFVYLSRLLDMQYNNTTTTVRTQTTSLIKFLHSTSKPHLTESSFPRSLLFSCLLSRLRFLAKSTAEKKGTVSLSSICNKTTTILSDQLTSRQLSRYIPKRHATNLSCTISLFSPIVNGNTNQ